jgi:DNA-binding MarR family transcriptional regulator
MVENQHSINSTLSFGAKSVNPNILEKLLIGRKETANLLEKKVKAIMNDNDNIFMLIIGQRGMGKTHLLKVLHSRIWNQNLEDKIKIAYFSEEEYGVSNFFDFLLRVLNALIKWYDKDKEHLSQQLDKLQITSVSNQLSFLEKIIKNYANDKPLLILAENFGDILQQMGKEEQGRLRAWLYENNNVSIIASSQSISDDFEKEDRPFYGFFTPYYLKNLSFEETLNLLLELAELDNDQELKEFLNHKGIAKIRAIYDLVKGNHRLIVTFYQFLKSDRLAKVSENFIKTINDLKPYYETFIRYLPAQQQKILRYIALSRKPQLGTEIAKNCFIDQKTLSKQLSELSKKNLIEIIPDPSDKRNKFYDINEPLLRISLEVGEHKEGISALFIDFLALYYNLDTLLIKSKNLIDSVLKSNENKWNEIKSETDAIFKALDIKNKNTPKKMLEIFDLVKMNNFEKAKEIFCLNFSECEDDQSLIFADILYDLSRDEESLYYFRKVNIDNLSKFSNLYYKHIEFYNLYSKALINTFIIKNDINLINEAIITSKNHYLLTNKITYEFFESRLLKIISFNEQDKIKILLEEIINIDFKYIPINFRGVIQEFLIFYFPKEQKNYTINFKKYFTEITENERLEYYEFFKDKYLNIIFVISDIIEKDLINNINLSVVLNQWFTNMLINSSNSNEDDINFLIQFIERNKEYINLTIQETYLKTYKEVVFNKNEKALFELPKEQREFFVKNILKRK